MHRSGLQERVIEDQPGATKKEQKKKKGSDRSCSVLSSASESLPPRDVRP